MTEGAKDEGGSPLRASLFALGLSSSKHLKHGGARVRNFIAQAVCGFSPVNPHTSAPPKPHAEGSFATPS